MTVFPTTFTFSYKQTARLSRSLTLTKSLTFFSGSESTYSPDFTKVHPSTFRVLLFMCKHGWKNIRTKSGGGMNTNATETSYCQRLAASKHLVKLLEKRWQKLSTDFTIHCSWYTFIQIMHTSTQLLQ